ncbi:phosphoglucosamine mutase [Pleurocapsa sp. CCALA 161]|uniref:phosphoglucosamine mutase n=1 Tax=Pleurocapsa sp. CCALA 161 TaxID=2107688 RepID=UPI000D04838A|nr:phosphoglucosamine mutase [Pleurocapsa sp. CCALA 161]PSB12110.1 phosphoglucosamine mutase [Pleurocapsa sp. CCALA 161]
MNNLAKTLINTDQLPQTPLFGTDGIRGKAGDILNAPFTLQLGYWAGKVLEQAVSRKGSIIVGQDSRNSSDMLAAAIAAGLTSAGLEVWNLGLCPTPCVANLASDSEAIGGIMISASHNPPQDNGIKFFSHKGTKLSDSLTQKIETHLRTDCMLQGANLAWGKSYQRPELVQQYVQSLQKSLPQNISFRGMRIVLDLAWGASVGVAPAIFQQLGAEVISLHDLANGDLINVNCGSTHLELLKQGVQDYHADLGFAFDGDADRVMAVDSQGRVIDGDYILYLWGDLLRQRQQLPDDLIVATVMANLGFERAWQAKGGKMQRTAVGDRHVQEAMWRTGAMLGGEQSGHILCHHHGVSGDGIQTALHLTSLVKQSETSLTELVDNSFQTYPQILRNVIVEDRERRSQWSECEPIQLAIAQAEAAMGEQGRILVRASGTEPLIRVMVEAADQQLTNYWTDKLVRVVEQNLAAQI